MKESDEKQIEELKEDMDLIRNFLAPYQKPLLYIVVIVFLLLLGFIGFAFGANNVCVQVDGFLDKFFQCHLDHYPNGTTKNITNVITIEGEPILFQ